MTEREIYVFDTETFLITPQEQFPKMVCLQADSTVRHAHLSGAWEAYHSLKAALESDVIMVGQETAYDMGVIAVRWPEFLPLIIEKYRRNQVTDLKIRQKLIDIARGTRKFSVVNGVLRKSTYSLDVLALRNGIEPPDKNDPWRLRYGELVDTEVKDWPEDAVKYAAYDETVTREIYWAQEERGRSPYHNWFQDEYHQARYAFALKIVSNNGLRTSPGAVEALKRTIGDLREKLSTELQMVGLIRPNGVRNIKAARTVMQKVCHDKGLVIPMTESGNVSLSAEACEMTEDPTLMKYAEYGSLNYTEKNSVKALEGGIDAPIHSYFETLQETGRTSSSRPNVQNVRRLPGIRECFVPREGMCYVQADYGGLELATWAQVCYSWLGQSRMREVLNEGRDAHLELAANINPDDPRSVRPLSKMTNFGLMGAMGPATFADQARGQGFSLEIERCRELKEHWLDTWPEAPVYFAHINALQARGEGIRSLFSERLRNDMTYCAACNYPFQALGSDVAKSALAAVVEESLTAKAAPDRTSILGWCRAVNFIHDEIILECPVGSQHMAAQRLREVMIDAAKPWLPDVKIDVEFSAMSVWSKNAKAVYNDDQELQIWTPESAA